MPNSGRSEQLGGRGVSGTLGAHPGGAGRGGSGLLVSGCAERAGAGTRWGGSARAHLAAATSCKGSK